MCIDEFESVCVDMCMNMGIDMCMGMCIDMHIDIKGAKLILGCTFF